jgi:hypothetical protein
MSSERLHCEPWLPRYMDYLTGSTINTLEGGR